MRFGVVTTSYPREPGDPAGHFVAGLNRYLVEEGHSVEVIAAGEPASGIGAATTEGSQIVRIPSSLFYRGGAPDALASGLSHGPLRALRTALAAARFSTEMTVACARRAQHWDAVISHWVVPCGLAAALAAPGLPHLAIAHSSDIHLLRRLGLGGAVRWLARRAQLCYTASSLVVPGAPGRVVPMGVHVADFAPPPGGPDAARARCGLGPRDPRRPSLLFLGRLVPVKGLALLLATLRELRDGGLSLELLVAGDGPLRAALQAQASALGLSGGDSQTVQFLGEVRGARKLDLLHAADVLVLPSQVLADGRTEGAPTVLLEALAAGLPVVATAVGGVAELVGDAGLVVPVAGSGAAQLSEEMNRALKRALGEPAWREATRARARARAQQFDWAVLAPRLLGPQLLGRQKR